MRIALVMPPWLPEDIFPTKTAKSQVNYWQPLGILYVAAYLREEGHRVTFLDGSFHSLEEIVKKARAFKPELVGIYSNTPLWKKAVQTATALKEATGAFVVAGGPYPTAIKEKALESYPFDAIVVGEGEISTSELAERVENGRSLSGVKGVIFRQDGRIISNPPREPIENLDILPFPARDLLENKDLYTPPPGTYRKKPVAIVITSRGCDRRCIFCYQLSGRKIRFRSVENVLDELELLCQQGYREVRFLDDNFTACYKRAEAIARGIKDRGLDLPWFFSSRVDTVDERLLRVFKSSGAWAVFFGAESGVQKNLNTLKKGVTLDQIETAVKSAKRAGLKVVLPFIFGIPGETFEDALKTIEFAIKLDPDFANFHTMTPFPGTELYERAQELGRIEGSLEEFTFEGAAFIPHTMTREEIERLRTIAFRKFYLRPRYIIRKLLQVRSYHELKAMLTGLRSLLWIALKEDALKFRCSKA